MDQGKLKIKRASIVQHIGEVRVYLSNGSNKWLCKLDNVGHKFGAVALDQKIPIRQGFLRRASP